MSVTMDIGTEMGLSEFDSHDFRCLVPPWLQPPEIEPDGDTVPDPEEAHIASWDSLWLLQWAMPIPGMMHIISKMLKEVHEGLRLWASMTMKLAELAKLLAIPQRRERFIEKCLRHNSRCLRPAL